MQLYQTGRRGKGSKRNAPRMIRACVPGRSLPSQAQPPPAPSSPPVKARTPALHSASPWACQAPSQGVGSPAGNHSCDRARERETTAGWLLLSPQLSQVEQVGLPLRLPGTGWRSFQGLPGRANWKQLCVGREHPGSWKQGPFCPVYRLVGLSEAPLPAITWPAKPASAGTHAG